MNQVPSELVDATRRVVLGSGGTGLEPAVWFSTTLVALGEALAFDPSHYPQHGDRPLYVIVVTGDFEMVAARGRRGARPPRGPVLLLAFEQDTLERVPAPSLLFQVPDAGPLGTPHPLDYQAP